jgi:hypothetical protein
MSYVAIIEVIEEILDKLCERYNCYIPGIWTEIIIYFGVPNQSCESFS